MDYGVNPKTGNPYRFSAETRERMSIAAKQKPPPSMETIELRSAALRRAWARRKTQTVVRTWVCKECHKKRHACEGHGGKKRKVK